MPDLREQAERCVRYELHVDQMDDPPYRIVRVETEVIGRFASRDAARQHMIDTEEERSDAEFHEAAVRGWAKTAASLQVEVIRLEDQLAGAVEDRNALATMLKRLIDVALVDGYGETVRDEAEALLARLGGQCDG